MTTLPIMDEADASAAEVARLRAKLTELRAQNERMLAALAGMLTWARRVKVLNPGSEVATAVIALKETRS